MLDSIQDGPQAVDPAEALLREVGAHLREARQERGKEIEDVAEILRIQPGYVVALERGDLSVMPGRTYALGFLRSYAHYLGFDGDDLIGQIKSNVGGLAGKAALQGRAPLSESRLPKVPLLLASLAALAGAYAGWAYVQHDQAVPELVDEVPPELLEQTPPESDAAPPGPVSSWSAASPTGHLLAEEPVARGMAPLPGGSLATEAQTPPAQAAMENPMPGETVPAIVAMVRSEAVAARSPVPKPAVPPEAARAPESPGARDVVPPMQVVPASAPAVAVVEPQTGEWSAAGVATEPGTSPVAPTTLAAVTAQPDADEGALEQEHPVSAREPEAAEALVVETPRPPRTYGDRTSGSRVVLRARSRAWVHVSSTHNDYLWVQTLRPGDTFVVPDRPDLVLWTGNAGGVEVLVDGALLPPLGPDKVVVRDVPLQPRALMRRLLPLPPMDAALDEELVESASAQDSGGEDEVSELASTVKPPMIWRSARSTGNHRAEEISEYGRSE